MNSSVASASRAPRSLRDSALARAAAAHEHIVALAIALVTAAVAFEPRIRVSGFTADDWALRAIAKFPQIRGYHSAVGALESSAGSRVGHMFYWLLAISLFGEHARLYTLTAAALAIVLAFCVYLLLRELRFSQVQSLAMMTLTIVAPAAETIRFWFTVGGLQICLSLFCLGLLFALRAFSAPPERRMRLHALSWGLYLASAVYAETALALIAAAGLVYLTRASFRDSVRRWLADMVIVVGGFIAALVFVSNTAGFNGIPASQWLEHANSIGGEVLTIFTKMLGPLSNGDRTLGLAGAGALLGASLVLWRRGNIEAGARRDLVRWGVTFLISVAGLIAGYAVFVPSMLYYEPLGLGLATHINAVATIPLAVCVFSVLMLTRRVGAELLAGVLPRALLVVTVLVGAWYGVIVLESLHSVRDDGRIWALASNRNFRVLNVLTAHLPHPVPNATIYTFGEAGTVASGMPIFYTSWEQTSAVKLAYHRPDIASYPVVAEGISIACTPSGISASVGGVTLNGAPSPYGRSYFLSTVTGAHTLISSARQCAAVVGQYPTGPYALYPPQEWSL